MFATLLSFALPVLADPSGSAILPLRRVRLYETGVGYFERQGRIAAAGTRLPLPKGHLDDALKTLVVLGDGETQVSGVQFVTAVSEGAARALAGLPETEGELGYAEVVQSLEGLDVEVQMLAGRAVRGRLLEVQGPFDVRVIKKGEVAQPAPPEHMLVLLTHNGAVQRVRTDRVAAILPLDDATSKRLDLAGATLSQRSAQSPHPLTVRVAGTGPIGLGYVAEAPVWRTTYRVVLGPQDEANLQVWALIHNDTDEDWRSVDVELVNGQPTSFLFPLAAPRYAWRELAEPADDLSTVAQLSTETADEMFLDGVAGAGGLGMTGRGYGAGGSASGTIGLGMTGTIGHGGGSSGSSLVIGDLAKFAHANGAESGAQFVYALANPVDLDAHHSALVPVIQSAIEAEAVTWFAVGENEGATGVRIVNTTAQTLPVGTVAFFSDGGFAGEAGLDRLKPQEQRFILHGHQLDVELTRRTEELGEVVRKVRWENDVIVCESVRTRAVTLQVDNRTQRPHRAFVGLSLPRNASVKGAPEMDYDPVSGTPLAVIPVGARGGAQHRLIAKTAEVRRHAAATHTPEFLRDLASESIPSVDARRLRSAAELVEQAASAQVDIARRRVTLEARGAELTRLRADLGSFGTASVRADTTKRLAKRLVDVEEAIRTDERAIAGLDTRVTRLRAQVVEGLSFLGKPASS